MKNYSEQTLKKLNISPDELLPATAEEKAANDQMRPSVSYWKDAMRRFMRNKLAMFMLALLIIIILAAIFGPILSPYTYKGQSADVRQGPSFAHPFGTDKLGRDIFVRVMYGTRISLLVGVVTMVLVCLIGITYGAIAAYVGGLCDNLMMRFVDLMMTIPSMLIIILLSVVMRDPLKAMLENPSMVAFASLGSGLISIFIVLALFNWLGMARSVRGALLMNRTQEYVLASEAMGARSKWVIKRHLLPNSIGVIIISATGVVPSAIMTESFLSFIGLGVAAPVPSLGSMANDALNGIISYPLNMVYPAVIISLIILCFNVLGDALRDALDPRMRK
ncbi:MAG TPA: ABC transporter permease [Candidatus Fimadaptatus faecigallinarum]|uniref:ABC transporter permease n=1 Tax=Candidatus Fimadaptatus faecigallinarum TaxID=2840814 RepID=A0A9D1S4P1_9FIRM|nr:ABC transporter permease [Candidatus Fimadaptatus faecigallinarum]